MKKIVLYLFPRSSLIPPMSVPSTRKADLLKELEDIDGWISDIQEITELGIEVRQHEFLITDDGFNVIAKEWEIYFNDPDIYHMLEVYGLPKNVRDKIIVGLKEIKELFTSRVCSFLSVIPEETMVLIEAQPVEEDE